MKQTQIFFALALFLLGALSCGTTDNLINQPEKLEPGEGLNIGSQAPDFELPDGNGALHALADYIGNDKKVVIVFYRGGW